MHIAAVMAYTITRVIHPLSDTMLNQHSKPLGSTGNLLKYLERTKKIAYVKRIYMYNIQEVIPTFPLN